jgi:hypothetical protein
MFTTVLAPGSNAYHYDHMHVEPITRHHRRRHQWKRPVASILEEGILSGSMLHLIARSLSLKVLPVELPIETWPVGIVQN